jgi:hypothetical protein
MLSRQVLLGARRERSEWLPRVEPPWVWGAETGTSALFSSITNQEPLLAEVDAVG